MKEILQSYIYNEKLIAQLYRRAAALTTNSTAQKDLLTASQESTVNAEYLNYFYKNDYGTNYDPMIPSTLIQGSYRELLNEILQMEINSYLDYRRQMFYQDNKQLKETLRAITDTKLGHILMLLSMILELDKPDKNGIS